MKLHHTLSGAALVAMASAHTIFLRLEAGGVENPTGFAIRTPSYDGPINDVLTADIACNGGPNPTTPSSGIINVNAGDTVRAVWRHTLTSTIDNDPTYIIDPSHKGPTLAYLKKVGDATTAVGAGAGWFKIQHEGLDVATNKWAVEKLLANKGYQDITIPKCIENGQYLLRAELIALHAAGSPFGAQFYMECAQINVSGGTGGSPATVSLPGAYSNSDPGVLINIYQNLQSYTIPGPAPLTCGATQATSSTKPASSSVKPVSTSTKAPTTTLVTSTKTTSSSKTPTTTASSAGAPLYGQCGGTGWTGPTACAVGTCVAQGAWYSQCSP